MIKGNICTRARCHPINTLASVVEVQQSYGVTRLRHGNITMSNVFQTTRMRTSIL